MNTKQTSRGSEAWKAIMYAIVFAMSLAFGTTNVMADNGKGGYSGTISGGYAGPGPTIVTVEQAKAMSDDARVALKGHIIQSLGGEDYVFKDASGTINVEISNKRWRGQNIGPNDIVEIHGKVDREWSDVEIEVKRIIKQ